MKSSLKALFAGTIILSCLFSLNITDTCAQETRKVEMKAVIYPDGDNVLEVISSSEDHTIFTELLEGSDISGELTQSGPHTVLAPTDEAFEALGYRLDEIRENPEEVQNLLKRHVLPHHIFGKEVEPSFGVEVKKGDMIGSNGVVHAVEEVIMPE